MSRHRSWAFTDFHEFPETEIPAAEWLGRYPDLPRWSYACLQREVAPGTGKYHIQGYFHFHQPVSLSRLKKSMARAHFEAAKGDAEANRRYCTKSESRCRDPPNVSHGPWEEGVLPRQGKRNDLSSACEAIVSGDIDKIPDEVWAKYHKGLMAVMDRHLKPRDSNADPPVVRWYWGGTGVGKSKRASEEAGESVYWVPGGKWWDGYRQQSTVVLDDFRPEDMPFHKLLKLLDRYPYRVEWKGGGCWVNTNLFIITAPDPPQFMYQSMCEKLVMQLVRRCSVIEEIK